MDTTAQEENQTPIALLIPNFCNFLSLTSLRVIQLAKTQPTYVLLNTYAYNNKQKYDNIKKFKKIMFANLTLLNLSILQKIIKRNPL